MKNPRDRIIAALITLLMILALFSLAVIASESVSVSAKSATLYEANTERFYYTKNADIRLPMASTTKIMTALVALEQAPVDMEITVPKEAVGVEGSSLYLKEGEKFTLRQLLYALMLRSANDVAETIACAVGGSLEGFVRLMNEKCESMGLVNTHFDNPHGLDGQTHYTTARELALITACALKNPLFKEICSTYKTVLENDDGEKRLVVNHNKLLKLYDGAIGVKTGYTKKCGRCLVGAAERDGVTLITVTINAPDDWNDHIRMFDYGFSILDGVTLCNEGEIELKVPVVNSETEWTTVKNRDSLNAVLPKERDEITKEILLDNYLTAPIDKDTPVGEVVFYQGKVEVGRVKLYPTETLNELKRKGLFNI